MSDKNEIIRSAAAQVAENYRKSDILMYGDALRMPSRSAVIEILRDCQKLIFPVYYGDGDLLKLPPEQYSALLMEHIHEKLFHQIALTMPECEENDNLAYEISTALIARMPAIQELLLMAAKQGLKDTDAYNAWMKDYLGKSKEYEIAKATLEREFIIPAVGNAAVDWVLDFSTATVTVTPREQTDD